jgi:uncharacterized protein YgfB (UPF0149 family)
MARPRKAVEDQWQAMTEPMQLEDGSRAVTWQNQQTGEMRIVSLGMHPEQQPNYQPMQVDQQEEIEETALDRVTSMLKLVGDSDRADLKVYRIREGQLEYCAQYKPEQFEEGSFELLRRRFGAGDYELRLYCNDPVTKRYGVRNRTRLKIADDKAPEETGLPSGMGQVLGAIADGQRQMLEALVQMKQQPARDPMEEMTKMLSMMTMMREAMGLNQQSQQKSSIGEIVDAIKELRAASSIIDNEKDDEDNPMKLLPSVLELVKAGVSQPQQPQPTLGVIPPVALPPDMVPPQQPQQPEEGDAELEDDPQNLRGLLQQLIAIRGQENDIPKAAMFIYEAMPDNIVEIMFSGVWWLALSAAAPEVKPHKDWLKAVRTVAIELFNQAEQDEGEPQNIDEPPKAA